MRRLLFTGLGFAVLCAAQSSVPARSETADKAVYQTVCGTCHSYDMVSDIRSAPEWEQTIDQMYGFGAKISDEQREAIRRYLLRNLIKVNVNTAKAAELPLVLDISEATARALVKYRAEHGDFKKLDDLKKVPGVDASKIEARRNRVAF